METTLETWQEGSGDDVEDLAAVEWRRRWTLGDWRGEMTLETWRVGSERLGSGENNGDLTAVERRRRVRLGGRGVAS